MSGLLRVTSRSQLPRTRVASCTVAPGRSTSTPKSRQSGSRRSRSSCPPLATGLALIRRSPCGRAPAAPPPAGPPRRTAPRDGRNAARPPARPGASVVAPSAAGTWWARKVPSTGSPSTTSGPVHPFGVRSTIIGHARARSPRRRCGRPAGSPRCGRERGRIVAASCWCTVAGSSPASRCAARSRSRASAIPAVVGGDPGQHRRIGDLVLVEGQDRQHGPVAGRIEELAACQLVASGPVSASPSPTTQKTIRSGLSRAAPYACSSE